MKNLILLLIITCSLSSFAQVGKDDVYFTPKKSLTEMSAAADKSDHIITCLDNYHNERMNAMGVGLVSLAAGAYSLTNTDNSNKEIASIVAGVAGVASLVMYIHAERWISRKKLTFKGNGVALRF